MLYYAVASVPMEAGLSRSHGLGVDRGMDEVSGPAITPTRDPAGASPAMAQWFAMKAEQPDALLFFRMGDFFELFFEDAQAAASALDISLTARGEHGGEPIPMCGVPVHASEAYLGRLIRRGFRVAIAEQMEDPKLRVGKAPIRRAVVRLITPGTITEEALLDSGRPNRLLALAEGADGIGCAWLEISTGAFETCHISAGPGRMGPRKVFDVSALLGRLDPAEVLAPPGLALGDWESRRGPVPVASPPATARRLVARFFEVASLDAFGSFSDAEAVAAAAALDYVRATQAGNMPRLSRPLPQGTAGALELDAATRASLEILRARDGGSHTLLGAVSHTLTAPGARKLSGWLAAPLADPAAIAERQDAWAWLLTDAAATGRLRSALRAVPDISRALGRLSLGRGSPRDLAALRDGMVAAGHAAAALDAVETRLPDLLAGARAAFAVDPELVTALAAALTDPAAHRLEDGGAIRAGFDAELDAHRGLRDESRAVLTKLQLDYAQRFGVASIKIRHHAQLGYVIEAPAAAVERLRAFSELTLRQGMANGARFTTPELADLDRRISEAGEHAQARERVVFGHLVKTCLGQAEALAACADALALLDAAQSAAKLAENGSWCRPVVTSDYEFNITRGRHPVVEAALSGAPLSGARVSGAGTFIANDCDLSPACRVLLLTGPNMAGKSTFLRQNAILVILAQAGLPVPAEAAVIGVVDRLFSRVGAADDLARGRSTFMVEMVETAAILNQAGPRSLVVVDEIGRGTSTLDGLAIAWAVLEALHSQIRCRTLFATHFHELAGLTDRLARIAPHTMRVKEWKGGVVFLHEVAQGAAGRSWGVHVAELAGVPAAVVKRAAQLLVMLEKGGGRSAGIESLPLFAAAPTGEPSKLVLSGLVPSGLVPSGLAIDPLRHEVSMIEPDRLSPREALEQLYRLKAILAVCDRESLD